MIGKNLQQRWKMKVDFFSRGQNSSFDCIDSSKTEKTPRCDLSSLYGLNFMLYLFQRFG